MFAQYRCVGPNLVGMLRWPPDPIQTLGGGGATIHLLTRPVVRELTSGVRMQAQFFPLPEGERGFEQESLTYYRSML